MDQTNYDALRADLTTRIEELTDNMCERSVALQDWGKMDTERDALKQKLYRLDRKPRYVRAAC